MPLAKLLARLPVDPYILCLVATVALAFLLPARGGGAAVMGVVTYAAVTLLFFLYGARLSPENVLAGVLHWRLQALILACTFVLFPAIGLALTAALGPLLTPELRLGLLYVCALPSTVQSSIAFTAIARGNVPAALCAASASNLLGMALTPALVGVLLGVHGSGGFSLGAVESIALQLLLPFALGQLARPLIAGWLGRHKGLTTLVDRGSILLVVYAAFSEGVVAGIWGKVGLADLLLIVLLDGLILAAVLLLTSLGSRRLGFTKEDEIAITFCGSKKSMAAGIPMANILFPATAVSLVVLPLMLFHQLQLFVCAALARRYAGRPAEEALAAGAQAAGRAEVKA